jgi:hypothetical protein
VERKGPQSLSAIARQITGTSWNGYTFFGIKRAAAGNKNAAGPRTKLAGRKRAGAAGQEDPKDHPRA